MTKMATTSIHAIFEVQSGAVVRVSDFGPKGLWFKIPRCAFPSVLEQVTFTPTLYGNVYRIECMDIVVAHDIFYVCS